MSIDMIGALGAVSPTSALSSAPSVTGPSLLGTGSDLGTGGSLGVGSDLGTYGLGANGVAGGSDAEATSSTNFAEALAKGLQSVQDAQTKQDTLATQAATGDLTNVHDYTVAAAQAKLATSLTVALRDKAIGAFNEILRMQV